MKNKKMKQQIINEIGYYNDLESTDPKERGKLIESAYKLKVFNALEKNETIAEQMIEIAKLCKKIADLDEKV